MKGLRGTDAKQMAIKLTASHPVSWQHIYKITKDLRPEQKTRSDKGKRTFELVEGTDIWVAAQLVISDKLDPDQALLTCKTRGLTNLPSLEYFQRILRENGLGKEQRAKSRRAFRPWEAEFPGEIYQIDVTALKVRWEDEKTRRILRIEGVDKNHPADDGKLRVWQIMGVDDCSRRRFLRYIATTKITSRDMVEFECEWFNDWGIPHKVYTDNGSEFKGYHIEAEQILNKILENDGGYYHERHKAGNPQASGKVEVAHKWAEKMDRYVGLAVTEGQHVTVEHLNRFSNDICNFYNNRVHRSTGETPMNRWYSRRIIVRKLPPEIIESALLSDKFDVSLDASMTVAHKGKIYRVPGVQPFVNYTGQMVSVVVPPNIDLILLKLPNATEYHEIEKVLATADKAGDYKANAESNADNLKKRLKETRKLEVAQIKQKKKETGQIAPVPHFNVPIEVEQTNVAHFPHKERIITLEEIAAVTPISQSVFSSKEMSYWEAVAEFSDRFADVDEAKQFFTDMFGEGEIIAANKLETAINNRFEYQQQPTRLRAVK